MLVEGETKLMAHSLLEWDYPQTSLGFLHIGGGGGSSQTCRKIITLCKSGWRKEGKKKSTNEDLSVLTVGMES